ncbi:hypothetical protein FisN_1Hh422 [Fistulifera solaris]|jgi:hypothetical protein|uniref:Uncharacterized protein n=1 Tax=Fistulifera solaris TaxID=1519565 RepID=A0A1Z5JJN9_FISSO|nr:hypothetical protein FisN_1Hh422 [Fistulifera solaris]|eukprot:GAX14230.1 hypothetical protein FisN_1Hh422 [Fistulifera solaris]
MFHSSQNYSSSAPVEESGNDHAKTEPLAQERDDAQKSKIEVWAQRIKTDAVHVWQVDDLIKYLRPQELSKLQNGFVRSTMLWVFEQINSPDGISDDKLEKVYDLYIKQFCEIASVMGKKKRTQKIRQAIQKYERHFRCGLNDAKSVSSLPSLLKEISALDYGQDVVFHFLCQRPDILYSR